MTTINVYRTLWRHAVLIVVLTALVGIVTAVALSGVTPVYEASTLVRVEQRLNDPTETAGSVQAAQALAQTYAEIVGSGALQPRIRGVMELAGTTPGRQKITVSASQVQDLELIWFSARSTSPAFATRVANATPVALRRFIQDTGPSRDRIIVVKAASVPRTPVSPNKKLDLALALLLGLIFNSGLALLLEFARDRLPKAEEFEAALGSPLLVTLPRVDLIPFERLNAGRDAAPSRRSKSGPPTERTRG